MKPTRCNLQQSNALCVSMKCCLGWIRETREAAIYILKCKADLQQIYRQKHGKNHAHSWTSETLILKITSEASTSRQEDTSFEQDIHEYYCRQPCSYFVE